MDIDESIYSAIPLCRDLGFDSTTKMRMERMTAEEKIDGGHWLWLALACAQERRYRSILISDRSVRRVAWISLRDNHWVVTDSSSGGTAADEPKDVCSVDRADWRTATVDDWARTSTVRLVERRQRVNGTVQEWSLNGCDEGPHCCRP